MFNKVLIADRGEIALRINRACHELGVKTVVVHSEADRNARYVGLADQALCIGPAVAAQSYLSSSAILLAAQASGAEAVHPGYGFLAENAEFAERVTACGLIFIGPTAASIRMMGDKIAAKRTMLESGVPCVSGPTSALPEEVSEIHAIAAEIGYPVIVKAAQGGGGCGMRVVRSAPELANAVARTRDDARLAFASTDLYIEKFLETPRHVEIQVICDAHGSALWLGDRDCSVQRRNQKVIEEAPAPGIPRNDIRRIAERCVKACRRIKYRGVGTFEFLYDDGDFFFIEMNTRLQVEHPVTEMTTGIDIVQEQIRIAGGERLCMTQSEVAIRGHAIEFRINAEHPRTFAPSPGTITRWEMPSGIGVRVDSHVVAGNVISPHYDSLIAKLIVHGATREQAIARAHVALLEMSIEGIDTNIPLHREVLADASFGAGGVDIHHLERWLTRSRETR